MSDYASFFYCIDGTWRQTDDDPVSGYFRVILLTKKTKQSLESRVIGIFRSDSPRNVLPEFGSSSQFFQHWFGELNP